MSEISQNKEFIIGESFKQCPVDYPYSFNYGIGCCFYDKDSSGNSIGPHSSTCYLNTYRFCREDRCKDNSKIS